MLDFEKLKTGIRALGLDSTRIDNDSYFEAVIKKDTIGGVMKLLEDALGRAAWPSKDKLPKTIQKLADGYGGLRKGQTLFFTDKEGVCLFAMLWPWQDGERTTIRLGRA